MLWQLRIGSTVVARCGNYSHAQATAASIERREPGTVVHVEQCEAYAAENDHRPPYGRSASRKVRPNRDECTQAELDRWIDDGGKLVENW